MIREQAQILLSLYTHPLRAASRIIDEGRFWFALAAALIALIAFEAPVRTAATGPAVRYVFENLGVIKVLFALAAGFVPGAVLVATLSRKHESFGVMLRKDYVPLLTCLLMSVAAAWLPIAALNALVRQPAWTGLLGFAWFLALAAGCARTLWGTGFAVAVGATAAGLGGALGALVLLTIVGPLVYFLGSPWVLYYGYVLLGSNVRSLGGGLRNRQQLRRQLEIAATNPHDADAHYQLGLIYQQRRQFDEAQKRFTRAIEIDASDADPFFQLGRIALEQDRYENAIGFLNRAAALDGKCSSHEVWRELGIAYLKAARPREAVAALGRFAERRPYDPEGLYRHGEALLALGDDDAAKQAFSACREAVDTMPAHRRRQLARWGRLASTKLRGMEKPTAGRASV